jgi:perosamine synthetase
MKIPYGKQSISNDDIEKVTSVLKSEYLTTGPTISEFESQFAKYVGAKYAIAVSSGTAALHLAAQSLGVSAGSEVITTPMSFAATSNCVLYNSGRPVFTDITERGLIDPSEITKKISEKTRGIIPVHYMGLPSDLDEISRIAKEHNLSIIEDASHAIGAKYRTSKIGDCKYSDLAVFSFHPVKHITTGEGGIITTNNKELNYLLRILRTHGITKDQSHFKSSHREPWYQEMQYLGFNYRMTDMQAALGLSQLARVDEFVRRRREIAKMYIEFFSDLDSINIIPEYENELHSYHLFVIKVKDAKTRLNLFEYLDRKGIHCQIHYIPIYWHPFYRENGYEKEMLPRTERFYDQIISLPMYPALTDSEVQLVLSSISAFFK